MSFHQLRRLLISQTLLLALALCACGGDSGDSDEPSVKQKQTSKPKKKLSMTFAGRSAAAWKSDLHNEDIFIRWHAAGMLGSAGPEHAWAIPALLKLSRLRVRDDYGRLCCETAQTALASIGPDALEAVLRAAKSADESRRLFALECIGAFGPAGKPALAILLTALRDRDSSVKNAAISSLARIGPSAGPAVPILLGMLTEGSGMGAREAVKALGQMAFAAEQIIPALIRAWNSQAFLASHIQNSLLRLGRPAVMPVLARMKKPDPDAAKLLARYGPLARPAVPELARLLTHSNAGLAKMAAEVLGQLGPIAAAAAPQLASAAAQRQTQQQGHERLRVRWAAIEALGRIGPAAAGTITELAALAARKDDRVATHALLVLGRLGPGSVPTLIKLLEGTNENQTIRACQALAKLGPAAAPAVPLLIRGLKLRWRSAAVTALGHIGPKAAPAVALLARRAKKAQGEYEQQPLLDALGRIGAPAVASLLRFCRAKDINLQIRAIRALKLAGPAAAPAVSRLLELFKSNNQQLAEDVVRTLGAIGPAAMAALPILLPLLEVKEYHQGTLAFLVVSRLSDVDPARLLPPLLEALVKSGFYDGKQPEIVKALERIGGPAVPYFVDQLVRCARRKPGSINNGVRNLCDLLRRHLDDAQYPRACERLKTAWSGEKNEKARRALGRAYVLLRWQPRQKR